MKDKVIGSEEVEKLKNQAIRGLCMYIKKSSRIKTAVLLNSDKNEEE